MVILRLDVNPEQMKSGQRKQNKAHDDLKWKMYIEFEEVKQQNELKEKTYKKSTKEASAILRIQVKITARNRHVRHKNRRDRINIIYTQNACFSLCFVAIRIVCVLNKA